MKMKIEKRKNVIIGYVFHIMVICIFQNVNGNNNTNNNTDTSKRK